MRKNKPIHFIFLGIASRGHIAPTLPLVKTLIGLGYKVTYFNTAAFKYLIEETGARFIDYSSECLNNISIPISLMEPHEITIELQKYFFVSTTEILPVITSYHASEAFDVVIYDQMALWGQIFADKYNLLSFCSNTMFLFNTEDIINQLPKFIPNLNSEYHSKLNLIKNASSNVVSYSDVLDIQTAAKSNYIITYYSKELLASPPNFDQKKIIYLGNRFDSAYSPSMVEFSSESLIYISLGTVFNEKIDLFTLFIDTFNGTNHQVIITTGNNETVCRALKNISVNSNIHIFKFVNQVEILSKASLFITHAGFNSIYEGLYFTVPMLMIPHIPEQYFNAIRVKELNAGYLLNADKIQKEGLAKALGEVQKEWFTYKSSAIKIRQSFLKSYNNLTAALKMLVFQEKYERKL